MPTGTNSAGSEGLRFILAAYAYPGIVFLVFVLLAVSMVLLVVTAPDQRTRVRRIVAVAVPLVLLVIATPGSSEISERLAKSMDNLSGAVLGLVGLVLGVGLIEAARLVSGADDEVIPSTFSLLLSGLASSLVWSIAFSAVDSLRWMLVVGVVGAGLDVVFRGLPRREGTSEPEAG